MSPLALKNVYYSQSTLARFKGQRPPRWEDVRPHYQRALALVQSNPNMAVDEFHFRLFGRRPCEKRLEAADFFLNAIKRELRS